MSDTKDITGLEEAQVHQDAPSKPSAPQWHGLRRVPDKLPTVAILILVVEVPKFIYIIVEEAKLMSSAGRTIYVFWSQRAHSELHQVCTRELLAELWTANSLFSLIVTPTTQRQISPEHSDADRPWRQRWATSSSFGLMHLLLLALL